MRWLMNLFKPRVVNNYNDYTPAYIMQQHEGALYIITKHGKLYKLYSSIATGDTVCEHVLTLNSF
jgi:hypothetical protein